MRVSHFDDDRTSHALGRLTVYDVFGDISNVSSSILDAKSSLIQFIDWLPAGV